MVYHRGFQHLEVAAEDFFVSRESSTGPTNLERSDEGVRSRNHLEHNRHILL
jgi:hypothetical protein